MRNVVPKYVVREKDDKNETERKFIHTTIYFSFLGGNSRKIKKIKK